MPAPKRRFAQHFLFDPGILGRIVGALAPGGEDTVLEVGPGPGGLTAALAPRVGRLIAIEKDRDLVPALRARFPAVEIVEGDALAVDWHRLVFGADPAVPRPFSVIGNIPYNITSPLIDKALLPPRPVRIVLLVQKEVAERVAASPGGAEYGALSVGVQAVARVERLFTVPAGAFRPVPKVDSAVLRLSPLRHPLLADQEVGGFRRLVVGLFGLRRKQLLRGLREHTGWPPDRVSALLEAAALPPTQRPEQLSPEEFLRLYRDLLGSGAGLGGPETG
ncbi:MAG: 16S rRNA (adenine(1518)-N(6)/adenine(1519)-N(6))-dimethyltransferase RsmA [Gemmatimonadales bacterium]